MTQAGKKREGQSENHEKVSKKVGGRGNWAGPRGLSTGGGEKEPNWWGSGEGGAESDLIETQKGGGGGGEKRERA